MSDQTARDEGMPDEVAPPVDGWPMIPEIRKVLMQNAALRARLEQEIAARKAAEQRMRDGWLQVADSGIAYYKERAETAEAKAQKLERDALQAMAAVVWAVGGKVSVPPSAIVTPRMLQREDDPETGNVIYTALAAEGRK